MTDYTFLNQMDLPKSNHFEELETLSEQQLYPLFDPSRFEFCTRDRRDKGLDITYEVKIPNGHTGFRFIIQLKATECIKPNKRKKIYSLSVDTSNINYLLNNNSPAFFILYVKSTNTFYYESCLDVLKVIQRKKDWSKQASHTIKFNNTLADAGINEIFNSAMQNGAANRLIKESTALIAESAKPSDRISIDKDLNILDDSKTRNTIESIGFELINEGKWQQIILVHNKATGNIASTARYNLILGIANYYGGNRWDAKSFFKKASVLKNELSEDHKKLLQFFDTTIDFSIGFITEDEYNSQIKNLRGRDTVGLYSKLDFAKQKYIESLKSTTGEKYEQYEEDIKEIISSPLADKNLILTAKCELILYRGYKNNSDYLKGFLALLSYEEAFGPDVNARANSANKFIQTNAAWYQFVREITHEAVESKKFFIYHYALINEVKVSYQFLIYTSSLKLNNITNKNIELQKPDNNLMLNNMLDRISLAINYFKQIWHPENLITAYSVMYEILHYKEDYSEANKILTELEFLVKQNDRKDFIEKLEYIKNKGCTHERFKEFYAEIKSNDTYYTGLKKMEHEMIQMDEMEKHINKKPRSDNYQIELFPIGSFQFPKTKKEIVFDILQIKKTELKDLFSEMFEIVTPIANVFHNPIEEEGFVDGHAANKTVENWKNMYLIRKAFFDNQFYRL